MQCAIFKIGIYDCRSPNLNSCFHENSKVEVAHLCELEASLFEDSANIKLTALPSVFHDFGTTPDTVLNEQATAKK